MFAVLRKAFP
ncbi:uncharacterized protein FRV6_05995 [Fusarium oxysporum]|uniref:Uncharacterized protein n=1 Tax=Fusarium oxysporum TaxID=5507 RepID=A0A2H3SZF7_FUSOX|nr:uncharacterized protein FRV6_05995 [Fusarium oxysporum]